MIPYCKWTKIQMPPRHSVWPVHPSKLITPSRTMSQLPWMSLIFSTWYSFSQYRVFCLCCFLCLRHPSCHCAYDHLVWNRHYPLVSTSAPSWFLCMLYFNLQLLYVFASLFIVFFVFSLYGIYYHQMSLTSYLLAFFWILSFIT